MTETPALITVEELDHDLHRVVAELRKDSPVAWVPALDGWMVMGRAEVLHVLRDATTFTVDDPRFSTARVIGPSMLSLDGDEHARHRDPWMAPFRPSTIDATLSDWTHNRARELVWEIQPTRKAELRSTLAAPLAVDVIQRALGFDSLDGAVLLGWYRSIVAAVQGIGAGVLDQPEGQAAYRSLAGAVDGAIAGGTSMLAEVMEDEGVADAAEVASNAAVVMFGAIETAEGMIANLFHHLLTNPDVLARVRADRSLVASAVEESLRMEPAAAVVDRYATADVEIGGAQIKAGDFVSVSLAAANRDPAEFREPHRFDLDRPNLRQHLTFVRGPHACIGAHLSRLEASAALTAVLDLLLDVAHVEAESTDPTGLVFRKPDSVVATWSAS